MNNLNENKNDEIIKLITMINLKTFIGDWAQSSIPNPQSPIPNPQSPIPNPQSPLI